MIIRVDGKKILKESEKKELMAVRDMGGKFITIHYMDMTFIRIYGVDTEFSKDNYIGSIIGETANALGEIFKNRECGYLNLEDIIKEYCED